MEAFSYLQQAIVTGFALLLGTYGVLFEPPTKLWVRVILRAFVSLAAFWLVLLLLAANHVARQPL